MSIDRNLELARLWYEEMWSKPNPDLADKIVHPDYDPVWVSIPKKGAEQVKHEIQYFRSVFPDLRYELVETVATETQVWIRYKASGTQTGKAWGFKATNKFVAFEGATILYVGNAGKVTDRWGAFSFFDIMHDLGLVPSLWELHQHFGNNQN